MTITWEAKDDTRWIEQAMDEYHANLHASNEKITKRNWKWSDVPALHSELLQRSAELKKEFTVKHYVAMAEEAAREES